MHSTGTENCLALASASAIFSSGVEALASAHYLVKRHAVRRITPAFDKGGLPPYRLKRVLDYIADNLGTDISLSDLATIAGMSPHSFSELFKQTVGRSPRTLMQRLQPRPERLGNR